MGLRRPIGNDARRPDVVPLDLGQEPPSDCELVRTLVPMSADEHVAWYTQTREQHRLCKLDELIAAAKAKGKPPEKVKLSKKDALAIEESLPATLFDALHADTSTLRKAGWNQPPGSRWINYARPANAFSPEPQTRRTRPACHAPAHDRPVCGVWPRTAFVDRGGVSRRAGADGVDGLLEEGA